VWAAVSAVYLSVLWNTLFSISCTLHLHGQCHNEGGGGRSPLPSVPLPLQARQKGRVGGKLPRASRRLGASQSLNKYNVHQRAPFIKLKNIFPRGAPRECFPGLRCGSRWVCALSTVSRGKILMVIKCLLPFSHAKL